MISRTYLLLWLIISCTAAQAVGPPPKQEPVRGAVVGGKVLLPLYDEEEDITTWSQPIGGERGARGPWCSSFSLSPLRWHVGHGAFWICDGQLGLDDRPAFEGLDRYELAELLKGRLVCAPGAKPAKGLPPGFAAAHPLGAFRTIAEAMEFPPVFHYDYLPAGRFEAKLFVLRNTGGWIGGGGETALLGATVLGDPTEEEKRAPRWSLTCYSTRSRWDAEVGHWRSQGWSEECKLEVRFKEAFQALAKGDDYYFVTSSGKLFRAGKPAKRGQARKVEPVWTDPDRRIAAFVTDADTNRTFLFCKPAKPGGKPSYFELGPKPKPVEYDPKAVKAPKAEGSLGTVLLCARVLVKDGKVKLPAKK